MPAGRALLILWTAFLAGPITAADDSPLRASEVKICREVVERACRGEGTSFGSDVRAVMFFTRIEGATGEAWVTHVFSHEGKEVRRVRRPIGGSSFRTWSTREVSGMPGKWRAVVLDPLGRSLGAVDFEVEKGTTSPDGPQAGP